MVESLYNIETRLAQVTCGEAQIKSSGMLLEDEALYPISINVPLHGKDSMDIIVDIDTKNRSFSLIVNGIPFKELPFESSTVPKGSDRITGGKLIINAKIVHQGLLHWDGVGRINEKYQEVLGKEKATSIVFDGLECSSSRVSDELLAFLVGMVDDNNLKVLSFK